MQDRLILTGVQMTPSPCRLVIIQVAQRAALRARPLNSNRMGQKNVNLPIFEFQFHTFDVPRISDAENLGVKLSILNGCSPLGAIPLNLYSAWAEDRAMLGSNPSAVQGPRPRWGVSMAPRFAFYLAASGFSLPPLLGIGIKALNPGGLGAGPHLYTHLEARIPHFVGCSQGHPFRPHQLSGQDHPELS